MSLQGSDEVLKHSWMTKRSQLKSRLTWTNYKERWFCLTKNSLAYFDGDDEKKKEKGKIIIRDIKLVEHVTLEDRPHSFQIRYSEGGQDYTLYIQAKSEAERDEWVGGVRSLVRANSCLADKFHPGVWSSKWLCCGEVSKGAPGCQPITWTPRNTKSDPAPPLPLSDPITDMDETPAPPERNVVVALYPFEAIEKGDLSLIKGEKYFVLDDSQDHWWQVENGNCEVGFIPSNYVKKMDETGLSTFDWYYADKSRVGSETLLKSEQKDGCFIVRNSSTKGMYTLSLFTIIPHPQVKHYHIKQNQNGFYLSEKHMCSSIPKLIEYHSHNAGGLACRLKSVPGRQVPATAGLAHGKWEVDHTELTLGEELGSGQFGVVRKGKWKGTRDVAVKMMKEGTMSEDDFIEEAKVMTKLRHHNLVQLYGVCSKNVRPIFIITEYMKHGSLLSFLRKLKSELYRDHNTLLDMALQVCRGMAYLEKHNYIHRDLAARNCLVGEQNVVKVADFGLARYVIDDQYTSNGGAKFPIKWSPPEVLNFTRFSSKSDVWAYGVMCWEVFTCGEMPYGRAKNPEVVERVQRGQILPMPPNCPGPVYEEVMRVCWATLPEDRPSFRVIKEKLTVISQDLSND